MKIYICSAYPYHDYHNFASWWLKNVAQANPSDKYQLVEDPEKADSILFTEHHPPQDPYFFKVLNHPLANKFREKCYLYNDSDKPLAIIPTISPSFEKDYFDEKFNRSGPYIARHTENSAVVYRENRTEPAYLFSFIGAARTHEIRKLIMNLSYEHSFLKDTSDKNLWQLSEEEKKLFEKQYVDVSLKSKFVLCPRGVGTNSYRLYETMEMGIAPVIISDQWVPMEGPAWDKFSIQILEKDVLNIPDILKSREKDYQIMGQIARKEWEKWFRKEVSFEIIANMVHELHLNRTKYSRLDYYKNFLQFTRSFHFRNLLRHFKKTYL